MRSCWRILWLVLATCAVVECNAGVVDEREAQLKAAYVFNFLKFVEWDERVPSDVLQICFEGADDVREALGQATTGKLVGTRKVLVRAIADSRDTQGCAAVYVDPSHAIVNRPSPALTIGAAQDFTRTGGIIRLYTENNRLRFVVNVGNARRAGLQISSNLLKLATQIEQEATL